MKIKTDFLVDNFFLIIFFSYCIKLFFFNFSVSFVIVFMLIIILIKTFNFKYLFESRNLLVTLYIMSIFISGAKAIFIPEFNINSLISAVTNTVLPIGMFMYFFNKDKVFIRINSLLFANKLFCVLGFILYIFMPKIYIKYLFNLMYGFYYENYLLNPRLNSLLSSIIIGNICVVSICLTIFLYRKSKISNKRLILDCFIYVICAILTFQRSAWLCLLIVLFAYLLYFSFIKRKGIKVLSLSIIFLVSIGVLIPKNLEEKLLARLETIGIAAVYERDNQWETSINKFKENPLGSGLGTDGYASFYNFNKNTTTDGNYFRIISEMGIFSIFFFVMLMQCLLSLTRRNLDLLLVILIYIIQLFGSNLIDTMYSGCLFWSVVGLGLNYKFSIVPKKENLNENISELYCSI